VLDAHQRSFEESICPAWLPVAAISIALSLRDMTIAERANREKCSVAGIIRLTLAFARRDVVKEMMDYA